MTHPAAKARRGYDAAARRERALEERAVTRSRILDAAEELFLSQGFRGTTVSSIAARADVSVQTIYLAAGSKAEVLRAVAGRAVLDRDDPIAVPDLEWVADLAAERDPRMQLRLLARELVALAERAFPLWRVLVEAAQTTPELAEDIREHDEGRRRDQAALVALLHDLAVPRERAVDIVSGFLRPDLWQVFVIERRWSPREVEDLAYDMLERLLLERRTAAREG